MVQRHGRLGLLVAASHDRYVDVTGGVQLALADEAAACAAAGTTHLHLAPAVARRLLADDAPPCPLQVTIDAQFAGLVSGEDAVAAIARVAATLPDRPRRFALHSVLGHRSDTLAALAAACGGDAVFWLHDFISLCEGYNLLRNDIASCGAPPAASMACRICANGPSRPRHRARIGTLFEAIPFHVLAPSRAALDFWLTRAELPFASARVAEPAALAALPPPASTPPEPEGPLRLAFLGFPLVHKGWPLFLDLVAAQALAPDTPPANALFHFATEDALAPMDGVTGIAVRVDAQHRDAAIAALAEQRIEAVLAASPWPETFSFVAHEALAAGAHVLTLEASGNIAALARREDRVHVFPNAETLLAHLAGGKARAQIRAAGHAAPRALAPAAGSLALFESLLAALPA